MNGEGKTQAASPALAWTLGDFLRAARACKDIEGQPVKPLELTLAEYERLRAIALPHLRIAGPRWHGHHTLDGVEIRIKD